MANRIQRMARTAFVFDDMTLPESGNDFDTALTNYYTFSKRFGIRDGCVLRQVHGSEIVKAENVNRTRPLFPLVSGEGDAIWTDEKSLWVGVFTADCLPVLIDAGNRVMAVHAGWRGLASGILAKSVNFLGVDSIVSVTFGPAAGGCCYEVGDEVTSALRDGGLEPLMTGRNLDIPGTAERQLRALGVTQVLRSDPFGCTICDTRFRSYRRSKPNAGRSLSVIAL